MYRGNHFHRVVCIPKKINAYLYNNCQNYDSALSLVISMCVLDLDDICRVSIMSKSRNSL